MTEVSSAPKKKRGIVLPIALAIVALALAGFLISRAGLDKALMKKVLDGFIAEAQERAKARGHDLTITYGDLEVVGSFTNKHVVVHKAVLVIKPLGQDPAQPGEEKGNDSLRATTDTIEIYPENSDLSALRIQLPQPIDLAGAEAPEKSLLKITSDVPPVLNVARVREGDVDYNDVSYASPSSMKLTYLREMQATGEEDKAPTLTPVYENITLAMKQGGGFQLHLAQDKSGLGRIAVNLQDISITPEKDPGVALSIPKIVGQWSNARNEKQVNAMHASLDIGPITSKDVNLPYQPISLVLDASYEGAVPNTPEAIAGASPKESTMVLKTFSLTTKDAGLNATANFTANASDVLPVGTANIALSNAPYVMGELRKYGVLSEQSEPVVSNMLMHITGKPLAELKDIVVPIERVRGGAFKIGNSTFEELAALMLGQAIKGATGATVPDAAAPLAPQLPPADKPKAAPIALPDHGVRG